MRTVRLTRPFGYNYTPRDCMVQYAEEHPGEAKFVTNGYSHRLVLQGIHYGYDHWQIDHIDESTDRVTLYLTCLSLNPDFPVL